MPRADRREPELLTINAAAKRLGRSRGWVKAEALKGNLPGVPIGDRLFVRNLSAFLDAQQIQPPAPSAPTLPATGPEPDISEWLPETLVF